MTNTIPAALVDGFIHLLETGRDDAGVLHDDVFVDLNVPHWRYQIQGRDALCGELASGSPHGATVTPGACVPTADGYVVEAQELQDDHVGAGTIYRTLSVLHTEDGRITEIVIYCTGAWDQDTQARQAAEAPMIRR